MIYYKITYHHTHFHCTFATNEAHAIENVKDWYQRETGKILKDCEINGVELV